MNDTLVTAPVPISEGLELRDLLALDELRQARVAEDVDRSRRVRDLRVSEAPSGIELLDLEGALIATVRRNTQQLDSATIGLEAGVDLLRVFAVLSEAILHDSRMVAQRSLDVLRALTQAELAGADLNDMVAILATLVGNPTIVKTPSHEVLAWSGDPSNFDLARETTVRTGSVAENALDVLRRRGILERLRFDRRPLRVESDEPTGMGPRVVCAIHAGGVNLGYVSISEGRRQLDSLDLLAVENAAAAIGLHLAHERAIQEAVQTRRSLLVSELLFHRGRDSHRARQTAQLLGIDLEHAYTVTVVQIRNSTGAASTVDDHKVQAITATLNFLLPRASFGGIVIPRESEQLLLVPDGGRPREVVEEVLRGAMSHHPDVDISAGISRPRPLIQGLLKSYDEAQLAERIGAESRGSLCITAYSELGALSLFGNLEEQHIEQFIDDLLGTDRAFRAEFQRTFSALAQAGYNKAAAGRRLNLHVNTIQYRLDKIRDRTGFDPEEGNGRFALECASRLMELIGRSVQ